MDKFSKLRPPDAVRIKVKIVSSLLNEQVADCSSTATTNESSIGSQHQHHQHLDAHLMSKVNETKKFCVDPQITSYEILTNLISQAFGLGNW